MQSVKLARFEQILVPPPAEKTELRADFSLSAAHLATGACALCVSSRIAYRSREHFKTIVLATSPHRSPVRSPIPLQAFEGKRIQDLSPPHNSLIDRGECRQPAKSAPLLRDAIDLRGDQGKSLIPMQQITLGAVHAAEQLTAADVVVNPHDPGGLASGTRLPANVAGGW